MAFAWLDEGGERTGNILSIMATCIAHDAELYIGHPDASDARRHAYAPALTR